MSNCIFASINKLINFLKNLLGLILRFCELYQNVMIERVSSHLVVISEFLDF